MNQKQRLDHALASRALVVSRSQAENLIRLGKVSVDGKLITKSGHFVSENAKIELTGGEQYVSRAGLKLASVAEVLELEFKNAVVLDVGSSTGGFTDYALRRGAKKVIAVDIGTNQLHHSLRKNPKIELHEKTDIRDVYHSSNLTPSRTVLEGVKLVFIQKHGLPTIIVIDISFMSLRLVLPHIAQNLAGDSTRIVAMVKPQFEAGREQTNKGVIKNDSIRRAILKDFEVWARQYFVIENKRDSHVAGAKGNRERFYVLKKLS